MWLIHTIRIMHWRSFLIFILVFQYTTFSLSPDNVWLIHIMWLIIRMCDSLTSFGSCDSYDHSDHSTHSHVWHEFIDPCDRNSFTRVTWFVRVTWLIRLGSASVKMLDNFDSFSTRYVCVPARCSALQYVVVCCSVCIAVCLNVQRGAVVMCFSALWFVVLRCSVSQCVAVFRCVSQCVAVCRNMLYCVAVCCSVLQCVAVCSTVL